MKRILLLLLVTCCLSLAAYGQSRTNRIYRNCPGSTTRAQVAIDAAGNITLTPCSGKTTTITGDAGSLTSYLTSTVTYNNTAALADTALSVTVASGGIYTIELVVHSASAVRALKLDFAGTVTPANFIGTWTGYEMPLTLADPTVGKGAQVTAMGTDFNPGGFDTFNMVFRFTGSLEVTTGGTFLLRGAQTIADASDTTILRGSTLKLTKMN